MTFIAVAMLLAPAFPASAQEGPSPQAVLMVANVAGECEILNSMVSFQKKNNLPGGNDYVSQFWASEASTLGLTVEQMADRCNTSTTAYNKLWDAATPKQPAGGNE